MHQQIDRTSLIDALEDIAQVGQPSARSVRMLDIGSEPYMKFFTEELLTDLIAPGGATCRMFEGPYGSGKSHLLFLIREAALDHDLAVVHTDLSQGLNLEDWQLITQHVLQNLEIRTPHGIVRSLPRILEIVAARRDVDAITTLTPLPHPGFERAMRLYMQPEGLKGTARQLIQQFLLGERVSVTELRKLGVSGVKHPLNSRNAQHVLRTALVMLHSAGVRGTLLLFDENEEVFQFSRSIPSKKVSRGANLLRHLIDATASGGLQATAAIFATLPGFLANCATAYPALGQRVELASADDELGWRSPVIPISQVTNGMSPERFLESLLDRIEELLGAAGAGAHFNRALLQVAGETVLERHAGAGYRRDLMKLIAGLTRSRLRLAEAS